MSVAWPLVLFYYTLGFSYLVYINRKNHHLKDKGFEEVPQMPNDEDDEPLLRIND